MRGRIENPEKKLEVKQMEKYKKFLVETTESEPSQEICHKVYRTGYLIDEATVRSPEIMIVISQVDNRSGDNGELHSPINAPSPDSEDWDYERHSVPIVERWQLGWKIDDGGNPCADVRLLNCIYTDWDSIESNLLWSWFRALGGKMKYPGHFICHIGTRLGIMEGDIVERTNSANDNDTYPDFHIITGELQSELASKNTDIKDSVSFISNLTREVKYTYDDYLLWTDDAKFELIDGVAYMF